MAWGGEGGGVIPKFLGLSTISNPTGTIFVGSYKIVSLVGLKNTSVGFFLVCIIHRVRVLPPVRLIQIIHFIPS